MTYVLIHGAWHGGWCWRPVAALLRKAGHEVHAPSLTGLGERKHLGGGRVDLDTHIQDVVGLIEMEDLHNVVLVGHSYGGMVITGAADRVPARIARLVYLDAFVPEDGKCLLDYAVPERAARMRHEGERTGFVTPPLMSLWGLTEQKHLDFVGPREVRHPYATMAQPIRLGNFAEWRAIPKAFVYCSSPATGSFDQFAAKYREDPAWRFHELKTGHDAMILMPGEVARLLQST
ncbi:MAG TPA: alpha/beta fold hydrolase [Burkholderiales bacterium]|nr:alpha/beta fold hydrolase [Burkholderiales bacterium]